MNTFEMILSDSTRTERFDNVVQFIGSDSTGAFGLKARHEKTVVVLRYGLARFSSDNESWLYLALPGGILQFSDNVLSIATTRYFLGEKRNELINKLTEEMAQEDSDVHGSKVLLAQIEQELIRRLTALSK